jgi:hypothetical protein
MDTKVFKGIIKICMDNGVDAEKALKIADEVDELFLANTLNSVQKIEPVFMGDPTDVHPVHKTHPVTQTGDAIPATGKTGQGSKIQPGFYNSLGEFCPQIKPFTSLEGEESSQG